MSDNRHPGLPPVLDQFPIGITVFYIAYSNDLPHFREGLPCPWRVKKGTVSCHTYATGIGWQLGTPGPDGIFRSLGDCFLTEAEAAQRIHDMLVELAATFLPAGETL